MFLLISTLVFKTRDDIGLNPCRLLYDKIVIIYLKVREGIQYIYCPYFAGFEKMLQKSRAPRICLALKLMEQMVF